MEYANLGRTNVQVSRIGFGCEPLGGSDWGEVDLGGALRAVRIALDAGVTLFDTADVYGLGTSEARLAEALGSSRHDVFIVTKFGVRWEANADGGRARTRLDASPEYLSLAVEGSLRRLRIDAIPLYLVHNPDPDTPLEATLEALERLRDRGLVRHCGLSNFHADDIERAARFPSVAAVEGQYSLLDRRVESDVIETARANRLGFLAYGVLAQGLLSGKYDEKTAHFGSNDRRHRLEHFTSDGLHRAAPTLQSLQRVAGESGVALSSLAAAWVLAQPGVTSAIMGAKTPNQVESNVNAVHLKLSRDLLASLLPKGDCSS